MRDSGKALPGARQALQMEPNMADEFVDPLIHLEVEFIKQEHY
jgi:hypothetical protein